MENEYTKFIEELRDKADILDIANGEAPLVRKGSHYFICCPFHPDKTASLCLYEQSNTYHCFGCHETGDVFKFIQNTQKTDFKGAVEYLARKYNMVVPEFKKGDKTSKDKKKQERLFNLMKDAARHYHDNLMSPKGKVARDYLEQRGITQKTIMDFGLGYSIDAQELPRFLKEKGYSYEEMSEAKVAFLKGNNSVYDPMHERFVIPVLNYLNQVVAFCGRIIRPQKDTDAKYYNTPESFLFHKSNELFGQHTFKKLRGVKDIILVEGHMDVVGLYQAGIQNVVASMGTALTQQQAHIIKKLMVERVYFMYDGDDAGQKGMQRGVDILRAEGLDVRVVDLTEDREAGVKKIDPDEFVKKFGVQAMKDKIYARSIPMYEYKIRNVLKGFDMKHAEERGKFAQAAIDAIKDIPTLVQAEPLINIIQSQSGVSSATLYDLLKVAKAGEEVKAPVIEEKKESDNFTKALRFIIYAAFGGVDGIKVKEEYSDCMFNQNLRELYEIFRLANGEVTLADLEENRETNPEVQEIFATAMSVGDKAAVKYFNDSRKYVLTTAAKSKRDILTRQLNDATLTQSQKSEILLQIANFNTFINKLKTEK